MRFEIIYDGNGKPCHVNTDNGFMMTSRAFDPKEDGWMLNQLNPNDFPAIQIGRNMEYLVAEVNSLRRQLWNEKETSNLYRGAAGFGSV